MWADLSDGDLTGAPGIHLTYSKWHQRAPGVDQSTARAPPYEPDSDSRPVQQSDELDITALITKRKKKPSNEPPPPLPQEDVPPLDSLDEDGQLSQEDLDFLVTTLSHLTERLDDPEPQLVRSVPAPPPNGDAHVYVRGYSIHQWRGFFQQLASAESNVLFNLLQSGFVPGLPPDLYAPSDLCAPSTDLRADLYAPPPPPPPPPPKTFPPASEGRFKQIARGKSTPEYYKYVLATPKEARRPGIDPITPRVAGTSWRLFQAEVRAWKRALHRRAESIDSEANRRQGTVS